MCHVSPVTYHVSHVTLLSFFFYKVVKLVGGGSVINGRPRLVLDVLGRMSPKKVLQHLLHDGQKCCVIKMSVSKPTIIEPHGCEVKRS